MDVSTHSRPKAAGCVKDIQATRRACFNSQPPEGGWTQGNALGSATTVSTHSRPKAAGQRRLIACPRGCCFNSQPPEGGWFKSYQDPCSWSGFNSQPPEGGWLTFGHLSHQHGSFNSQPPEGGWEADLLAAVHGSVSTHSRPKAAGMMIFKD